jgi:nucleoside-diphosphate-sugar epimerase
VVRVFLPYGPYDQPAKVLAAAAAALRDGRPVALSLCEQRRDLLYIDDLCDAYEAVIRHVLDVGSFEVFNVCAGESPRLRDAIEVLASLLGADPSLCRFGAIPMRPGEPTVVAGSPAKAARLLGWRPAPLNEGLRRFGEHLTSGGTGR